jgi:hypothetical protein
MGKPVAAALANAKAVAQRMRKPDFYLNKLQVIESGTYTQFDWQAPFQGGA